MRMRCWAYNASMTDESNIARMSGIPEGAMYDLLRGRGGSGAGGSGGGGCGGCLIRAMLIILTLSGFVFVVAMVVLFVVMVGGVLFR